MKYFILSGTIDEVLVQKFVDFVHAAGEEKITIYLTSSGGADVGMYIIRNIINSFPAYYTLHAVETIYSCAFELFFTVKCKRIIAPGTIGMYHQSTVEMRMQGNNKPYYDTDKIRLKDLSDSNLHLVQFMYSIGADAFSVKKMIKGEDVYFQTDILRQFLSYEHGQSPINTKRSNGSGNGQSRKVTQLVQGQEVATAADTISALQAGE